MNSKRMVTSNHSPHVTVTLDDLIALNDEILALTRSGVPLEQGLVALGGDLSGRLGKIATAVGRQMQAGESLSEVLRSRGDQIPPVYRAVVEAGILAGRLPAALEGLARTARRVAELRRTIGMALLYPLLVLTIVCLLLAFVVPQTVRVVSSSSRSHRVADFSGADRLVPLLDSAYLWIWCIPAAMISLAIWWWYHAGRAVSARPSWLTRYARWIPWFGNLVHCGRVATFCELLGLLVEHQVPLSEGVELAADASGDPQIRAEAHAMAQQIRRGQFPKPAAGKRPAIPPLVAWTLTAGQPQVDLPGALRHAADTYYRQAEHVSDWTRLYLPMILTLGIGGTAAMTYVLLVLAPWFHFLYELATSA